MSDEPRFRISDCSRKRLVDGLTDPMVIEVDRDERPALGVQKQRSVGSFTESDQFPRPSLGSEE